MSQPTSSKAPAAGAKPGRGEFKCFHCRKIYPSKDGNWFNWKDMEVHLCRGCDKATVAHPDRKKR